MSNYQSIGVIGAGAWGTALAQTAASAGRSVTLWSFEQDVADAINSKHENTIYLPDVALENSIMATTAMSELDACDAILAVAPAQHLRRVLESFLPYAQPGVPIALCAKGIERQNNIFQARARLHNFRKVRVPRRVFGPGFIICRAWLRRFHNLFQLNTEDQIIARLDLAARARIVAISKRCRNVENKLVAN